MAVQQAQRRKQACTISLALAGSSQHDIDNIPVGLRILDKDCTKVEHTALVYMQQKLEDCVKRALVAPSNLQTAHRTITKPRLEPSAAMPIVPGYSRIGLKLQEAGCAQIVEHRPYNVACDLPGTAHITGQYIFQISPWSTELFASEIMRQVADTWS